MEEININNLAAKVVRLEATIEFLNTRIAFLETKAAEHELAFEVINQNINKQADREEENSKDVKAMLEMSKKVHELLVNNIEGQE